MSGPIGAIDGFMLSAPVHLFVLDSWGTHTLSVVTVCAVLTAVPVIAVPVVLHVTIPVTAGLLAACTGEYLERGEVVPIGAARAVTGVAAVAVVVPVPIAIAAAIILTRRVVTGAAPRAGRPTTGRGATRPAIAVAAVEPPGRGRRGTGPLKQC